MSPENLKHIKTDGWNHLTDRGFPWRSENISCEYDSDSEELQPRIGILIISLLALCGVEPVQYGNVCVSLQLLSLAFIMNKFIIFLAQARSQDNRMDILYARHHEARA